MTRQEKIELIKEKIDEMGLEYKFKDGVFYFSSKKLTRDQANTLYALALELRCSWEDVPAFYRKVGHQQWKGYGSSWSE